MKKTLLILLIFINFLFAKDKQITLQLNWLHQFQFAGYYMAKEKGFYKDAMLDVNFKEYTAETNNIEEIKTKRADFAIGRSSILIDKVKGEDIVALGAIFEQSPLMLLVRKDSNINEVKDLKDKKIMFTNDTSYSASILAMLNSNGLKKGDYEIQTHSFSLEDLISNKTDAMASYLSNEPILLKEKDIEYNIFHPKDYGFNFYSDILFTSSEFINRNPKLTKKFYDASIKGWQYAFENLAETAEIIYSKYNTQNKSVVTLIKEGEVLKKLAYSGNKNLGDINENRLNNMINVFKVFGLIKNHINANDFIYEDNPYKTMNIEVSEQEKKYIFFLIVLLFMVLAISIYSFARNRQNKKLLHTIINATDDLIFYKDNRFKYLGCNKSFERYINKKESEIIGKDDFELFNIDLAHFFRKNDLAVIKAKSIKLNHEWLTIENEIRYFQTKKIPFSYKKNCTDGILGISRDITDLYKIQEKLKEQAHYDELTNCYNRKAYNERIAEKFHLYDRYQTNFAIATYDIDDFKNINDTYGHDIGDKVLIEISKEIKSIIRKTDLLFRVGGEEFIIIFPKTPVDEAFIIVEKMRMDISNMNIIENEKITISIGITEVKEDDDAHSIYERVDKLMYKSKNNNKNQTTKG